MNLGENIRRIRKEKDKKQQEIYEAIGLNQSTYSKIENNKYKMDIETLKDIANALGVDVTKLLSDDKIEIKHSNNDNASGDSGFIVIKNLSEELIISLKEQINMQSKLIEKLEKENQELKAKINT